MHPVPPLLDPLASVVAHSPAQTRAYLGSPSIVRLPDASLASHDFFGPGAPHDHLRGARIPTHVLPLRDRGATGSGLPRSPGHSGPLFPAPRRAYLLGCTAEYGDIAIRRSDDGGRRWTTPSDERTGLLFPGGPGRENPNYHCAPVPVSSTAGGSGARSGLP